MSPLLKLSSACTLLISLHILSLQVHAADIIAITSERVAVLGSAYSNDTQKLVGQACVEGPSDLVGPTSATLSFEQKLTERQTAEELGFSAGGRARLGAAKASAEAKFFRSAKATENSVSAIWSSEYRLPSLKLLNPIKSRIGNIVGSDDLRWAETCGDEYVDEIVRGAKLLFSIRVDFSSRERKESFQSKFAISGTLYSANASLQTASQEFAKDARVVITALQIGGDVSKFTGIFPSTEGGRAGFVSCTLGNFEKCSEIVQAALKYATDENNGFGSQLSSDSAKNSNYILYRTNKYSSMGAYPNSSPIVNDEIRRSRAKIHDEFEIALSLRVLFESLLELSTIEELKKRIVEEKGKNEQNIDLIISAANSCYDIPQSCIKIGKDLTLQSIDKSVLELPPLPKAEYLISTALDGVWDRASSLRVMVDEARSWHRVAIDKLCDPYPFLCGLDFKHPSREVDIVKYAWDRTNTANVILFVQGPKLQDAKIYFDGKLIKTLPLNTAEREREGRYSDKSSTIVMITGKNNPGWLDVDLNELTIELSKEIPSGDGVFYFIVRDGFGRETRFDIAYQNWATKVLVNDHPPGSRSRHVDLLRRHRWWGEDGSKIEVRGAGKWSLDERGAIGKPE